MNVIQRVRVFINYKHAWLSTYFDFIPFYNLNKCNSYAKKYDQSLSFIIMNQIFQLLLATFALFFITHSKIYDQQITLTFLRRNKGWVFLDRIYFAQGQAQIKFNTKLIVKDAEPNKAYIIQLAVVPDSQWNNQVLMKCSKQTKSYVEDESELKGIKPFSLFSVMNNQNNYESGLLQTIQILQAGTYHFILKDCEKNLVNQYFNRDSKLQVQLQLKNNGKLYGEDEQSNFYWFPALIIGTLIMLKLARAQNSSQIDSKDTDWVKILLLICLWLNFASLISKYVGYLIYLNSGSQYAFFDFMYLIFHSVSDSVIITILVFVSFGWTITFLNGKDFDLYIPLVSMLGLITVILTLLNKITDGTHDKYHMYDTIPAYLLVFFKIVTLFVFIVGCAKTYLGTKQILIKRFYIQILFLGFFYLSSIPLIMLLIENIPASQRKEWMFILIQLVKNMICVLLTYMISYKKSGYRLISFGDKSFMQAGTKIL